MVSKIIPYSPTNCLISERYFELHVAITVPAFQRVSPDVKPGPGDRRPERKFREFSQSFQAMLV